MKYNNYKFYSSRLYDNKNVKRVGSDISGWRLFSTDTINNYIEFYPFSEYHGGGQVFMINIKSEDFDKWICNFPDFDEDIRQLFEKGFDKCPCCGYKTISTIGEYEICDLCLWEDDPSQRDNSLSLGANKVSLKKGQENFLRFGICDRDLIDKITKQI